MLRSSFSLFNPLKSLLAMKHMTTRLRMQKKIYDLFIHDNSLLIGLALILVVKAIMRNKGKLSTFATVE